MPASPRTPRRTSAAGRGNGDDSPSSTARARPRSAYDPASVQDRIRQWQAQGAANAPAPDAVSVRSIPASVASSDVSRAESPGRDSPTPAPVRRNRWATQAKDSPTTGRESRSSSAPRKRLVSDEHWKSGRRDGLKKSPASGRRKDIVTPHHDMTYTSTQRKEEREARRERRRQDRLSRDNAHDTAETVPKDLNAYIDQELAQRQTSFEHPTHAANDNEPDDLRETGSQRSYSMYDDAAHTVLPSRYADTLGQPEPLNFGSKRSTGGRLLNKTREMFNKQESPQVSNRVPSIQAWLEDQPDPFVEQGSREHDELPVPEVPKPLRRRSERAKRKEKEQHQEHVDPNKIWESVTTYKVQSSGIERQHTASSPPQAASPYIEETRRNSSHTPDRDVEESSPKSLRRRGAGRTRRSRRSESAAQDSIPITQPSYTSPETSEANPTAAPFQSSSSDPQPGASNATARTTKKLPPLPSYEDDQLALAGECGLKRRLTTHEDLMSVLSVPMHRKSTRSRRAAQNVRQVSATHVLETLVAEEEKYAKELRTLVDGVVPVLLQAVLSKSSSVAAAGLFSSIVDPNDFSYTKPIIDMGIALERLKSLHARIPLRSVDALLAWAQNARKAYGDYIKAWRLGFQDVIVNLAPLEDGSSSVDPAMSRDTEGDVIDSKGERVDVAYLLKRPLVRVKNLAKIFESIKTCHEKPLSIEVCQAFTDLTSLARQRHREEQARLEDEAAATVDASRARNVRTLAACSGVVVDKSRKVRARDTFDLAVWHSTGQRLDCQVEMIFRDNPADAPSGGDVLICEIDESGKWLLFSPVELSSISARRGEDDIDLVIMIRGPSGIGKEWHELLALKSDDPEAINEWMTMLGSCPLPPRLNRSRSFLERRDAAVKQEISRPTTADSKASSASMSVPSQPDVPLGEPSEVGAKSPTSPSRTHRPLLERFVPRLNLGGGLQSKIAQPIPSHAQVPPRKPVPSTVSSNASSISDQTISRIGGHKKSASVPSTPVQKPKSREPASVPKQVAADELYVMSGALMPRKTPVGAQDAAHCEKFSGQTQSDDGKEERPDVTSSSSSEIPKRPGFARNLSATPSEGLPTIPKLRKAGQERSESSVPLTQSIKDQWMSLSGSPKHDPSYQQPNTRHHAAASGETTTRAQDTTRRRDGAEQTPPPKPPPHRNGSPGQLKSTPAKKLADAPVLTPKGNAKRRSSSPLKHEYAPSTASDTSSDSDSADGSDASSETSEDFMSEVKDISTPLVAVSGSNKRNSQLLRQAPTHPPPSTAPPTAGPRTLAPSDSASQGPYRRVPSSTTIPADQKSRTIALICSWSDRGMWEQVHPDECSIVVSPGLIEAYQMSAAHSGARASDGVEGRDLESLAASQSLHPLVAFELTPIVPLRRGTALDINIRSPPTSNSMLRTTNNILFRSRNADECDVLYNMINWARCNNPTYIQLEKARPRQPPVSFNTGPARESRTRSGGSWFSFGDRDKGPSYRASSAPISVGGETEASTSTMATAFSALKRLGVSTGFNLNRSSVSRKSGWTSHTSGSLYSSNSGHGSGSGSSTPIPSQLGLVPGREGPNVPTTSAEAVNGGGMVNNMKIRLYVRKGQNWANLGSGRLSVLPAPEAHSEPVEVPETELGGSSQSTPVRGQPGTKGPRLASSGHTPHRLHGDGREKRIVVRKTKKDEAIMLDVVLGESCFERVMQTGIAVKVWTENAAVAHTGGVMMGREQIYMMQFPGTREAGWVFGLVGSYRYTTGN